MNLSQLQAEAGRLLSDANNGRWSTDILTLRLNLAQIEVQGYTNAIKTVENLTPVAGTQIIGVNSNTMEILYATKTTVGGEVLELPGITIYELNLKYPNWRQWSQGEPLLFFHYATVNEIFLVPTPNAANAITNGIQLWESRAPADMVNPTDIPFDSYASMIPYHMAIVHWTVAQCWMDDGTPESLAKARYHKTGDMAKPGQYELQLKRINDKFDVSEQADSQITYIPQGGRVGSWGTPSKSFPLV